MTSLPFASLSRSRTARARALAERHPASREALYFYADVSRFQEDRSTSLRSASAVPPNTAQRLEPGTLDTAALSRWRGALVELVLAKGPGPLQEQARILDNAACQAALHAYLSGEDSVSPRSFFARVLLQPVIAGMRLANQEPQDEGGNRADSFRCPFCGHLPQAGCLRPRGDGLALSLICSLCLNEWPFFRGKCPACGQTKAESLAYYSAKPEFKHIQIQACESCRRYLHTVDISQELRAIPDVDELSALPLDVWAHQNGFEKLRPNLLGI